MTDNTELKRLAQRVIDIEALDGGEPIGEAWGEFEAAATPAAVLALIAENERLHESDQEATELCDTLSVLLGEIAVAVRGPEEPKSRHGFHDLPSRVKTVVSERDQLKADNERLRADYAGLARFNPEWDRAAAAQDSVREHMAMVVQLKAEVAGLRTGYEAYERVNAELKAEVGALRQIISDSATSCGAAVSVECTLDFMKHLPVEIFSVISKLRNALAECADSLHGEMLQKFGGQLPDDMHPVTRREYDRDMAEVVGCRAALGQGEQS
ncbi:MAG TPA: hypothetical protein DIW67_11225 [Pseudomonas sp.]|uniref:hypothetical protein n=1 Tax=Pseudomonas sp. TaxID=306 RepID=UPI000ED1B24C|nr:hypothetical protein [Pseudomonas sp.]HCS07693.1 hypothetical protein [Pseudomonas sp.]